MGNTIEQQTLDQDIMARVRNALIAITLLVPIQIQAEPLDRDVLEAEDTIWIADDVTLSAIAGITGAGFPTAIFDDGSVTDGIATLGLYNSARQCPDIFDCEHNTNRLTIKTATYKIEGDTLEFRDVEVREIGTLSPESRFALYAEGLVPFATSVPARMENVALIVDLTYETRRYLPFPKDGIDQVMGVFYALEISALKFGSCVIKGHNARLSLSKADRTPLDEQMLDFAAHSVFRYKRFIQMGKISRSGNHSRADWSQEETKRFEKLQFSSLIVMLFKNHLIQQQQESLRLDTGSLVPNYDTIWKLAIDQFPKIPPVVQREEAYFRETLREELLLFYNIADTFAKLQEMSEQGGEEPLRQYLCP